MLGLKALDVRPNAQLSTRVTYWSTLHAHASTYRGKLDSSQRSIVARIQKCLEREEAKEEPEESAPLSSWPVSPSFSAKWVNLRLIAKDSHGNKVKFDREESLVQDYYSSGPGIYVVFNFKGLYAYSTGINFLIEAKKSYLMATIGFKAAAAQIVGVVKSIRPTLQVGVAGADITMDELTAMAAAKWNLPLYDPNTAKQMIADLIREGGFKYRVHMSRLDWNYGKEKVISIRSDSPTAHNTRGKPVPRPWVETS